MKRAQNALVFLAGSVIGGLALAFVVVALRPELLAPRAPAGAAAALPEAARTPAAAAPLAAQEGLAPRATEPSTGSRAATAGTALVTAGQTARQATETAAVATGPRTSSYAPAVERAAPAVVNIFTARLVTERVPRSVFEDPFGDLGPRFRQRVERSLGSGVVIDAAGHIATNHHVIADADAVRVQLADGREAEAQVIGRDPDTDLAVLSVALRDLPVMPLGRSDRLRVGDVVLAIGNPIGLSQTVTQGIVSATGRGQLGVATFENFIQTDAPINFGNSGGALINTEGELVGINTAVLAKNLGVEGIGFAIPVNLVRGVVGELIAKGRVVRGWLGIVPEDVDADQARQIGLPRAGVVISDLYRNGPALAAGLRPGDLLLAIDGRPVQSAQETLARVAQATPGDTLRLRVQRGASAGDVEVPVAERPARSR
jgi:serine peptidase DegS